MNFACDKCQKAYTIADEKVAGRAFKVTCRQCGHVIQVKATAPAPAAAPAVPAAPPPRVAPPTGPPRTPPQAAQPRPPSPPPAPPPPAAAAPPRSAVARPAPPPAPVLPAPVLPAPVLPAPVLPPDAPPDAPPAATPPPSIEHQQLETTEQHDLFYASQPTHRPRVTAEWMLQNRKKHPYLLVVLASVAGLVVAAGLSVSIWAGIRSSRPPPAEFEVKPDAPRVPRPMVMPDEAVKGAKAALPAPIPEPPPVELPPEQPLAQRGAAVPRAAGGQTAFESVGGAGGVDARERQHKKNLTIAKGDRKLLDLLDKKADAAPSRAAAVEKSALDTGGAALDAAAVRQTMSGSANAYAACVTRAIKENPGVRVDGRRATLMLTIRPSGVVQSAWIAEAELDKSPLGKCLVAAAKRMIFPAFSGDPQDVSVPLVLSAQL